MITRWYDPEQAVDWRAGYAGHFENDGTGRDRQAAVTDRAARAMRDGGRDMSGARRETRAAA